ncbi:hypothetical protein LTR37_014505 [Vermiconidia calcicola]|uniref:Uncharacterized protein n=1 Tax=Vermiconidia calcicola TaxID=1690605 RepID=A0ACC3MUC2_9PEZI|nr:hypothetical protein LTR37_014505 [Vermiconidia calcicola]
MPSQERPSFYFYNRGYHPKELTLGQLVYGNYGAPTQERNISAGQLVPEAFLNDKILRSKDVVTALRNWTDLRNTNYVTRYVEKGRVRTPSIWMLTGLYELEDATSFFTKESTISPSVGVGAEISALLGAPVGGSISTEHGQSSSSSSTLPGLSIWAAQYKLLDIRYVRISKDQVLPPLTLPVEVRNTTSKGQLLGGDGEHEQAKTACAVEIVLAGATESQSVDPDAYDRKFWERMARAEERWQHAGVD